MVTYTLAYYDTALITAVQSFTIQETDVSPYGELIMPSHKVEEQKVLQMMPQGPVS